jgi:hypothetical protein
MLTFCARRSDPAAVRRELDGVDVRDVSAILLDALIVFGVPQPVSIGEKRETKKFRKSSSG